MKNDYRIKAKDTVTEVKRGLIATIISLSPRTQVAAILCLEGDQEIVLLTTLLLLLFVRGPPLFVPQELLFEYFH